MRMLYISKGETADFLCDTLFHGLRTLMGPDIVDVNRQWFNYKDGFDNGIPWHTFYGLLPGEKEMPIDRSDIERKIKSRYFDYIVYGSIHRHRLYIDIACDRYHPSRVIFVDGEDDFDLLAYERIEQQNWENGPNGYRSRVPTGHPYFKRELSSDDKAWPIGFSIPKEMISENTPPKVRLMAPCDPRDPSTYKFPDHKSYYQQYAESCFGVTMKKGGWDCARHTEIMAAGAIPYFIDIENCPRGTLTFLQKDILKEARLICDLAHGTMNYMELGHYYRLLDKVRSNLFNHLTTEAMAHYFLERIKQ